MPDNTPLINQLSTLLADVTTLYAAAHGAHWNVAGSDFSEYHSLFEAIYTDVYDSIDPIAENIRKLDGLAPFGLADYVSRREIDDPPISSAADDLCEQLLAANEAVLACLNESFQLATGLNQQGIANFLAERIDAHQKWSWQLKMSLADDAAEDAAEAEPADEPGAEPVVPVQVMPRSRPRTPELRSIIADPVRVDNDGRHRLILPFQLEARDSGNPDTPYETTIRGHAAVFNSLSEDLGGFRELLAPGAFRAALRNKPDVRLLLNHDSNYVMARTASGTLELREDGEGLHVFARVDRRIQWVDDLRTSMLRGDIDQMSFAFTVADKGDEWAATEDGTVIRTILPDGVDGLYDVSVVTYPAYEATRVTMRSVLEGAAAAGKLPESLARGLTNGIASSTGAASIAPTAGADRESPTGGSGVHARAALVRLRSRANQTPKKETHQ